MKRFPKFAALSLSLLFAAGSFAQQHAGCKDHSSNPDLYFLYEGQAPNSLYLLPAPPDGASVQFMYDQARYNWGKALRNTERGEQAYRDARVSGQDLPDAFTEVFGIRITPEDTPEIYKLIVGMREDAGDLATRDAKNHYNRQRPFAFYGEDTCNPEQQAELSTNGSYPSGHTSIGWATALVLAEVNPDNQDAILERGYQMGDSRVICGYHWQSDIDAGRVTGSAVVARLHADEGFNKQLAKAKKEFAQKVKEGKVKIQKK